jgi:gliding motility-associated-like protein
MYILEIMKKILPFIFALALTSSSVHAQLVVDNSITVDEAIASLLGPDVLFSNVTFSGATNQIGSFNSANANVGIGNVIILATGDIALALGPNNQGGGTLGGGAGNATDVDLDLLDPQYNHNDAAVLEFDFEATGPSVSFRYVFASEEYPEYTGASDICGDVSDAFGFFLSGPGINGTFTSDAVNIAIIPGTSEFVSINTLNGGCTGLAEPGDPACNYCEFYVNNGDGFTAPYNEVNTYIQYDGMTVVLTATYEGLECGEIYHIKLVIADASDTILDSGVFLEAGSFEVTGSFIEANLEDPDNAPLGPTTLIEGCVDGFILIHPPACSATELEVELAFSGTAINGLDYEEIPTTVTIMGEEVILPIIPTTDLLNDEGLETIIIDMYYINFEGDLDTASTAIDLFDYVQPAVEIGDVFVCNETVVVTPEITGGIAPYNYVWSNGGNNATTQFSTGDAGEYNVSITDFCSTTFATDFTVIEPEPLQVVPLLDNCFGVPTGDLARNGAPPYDVVYSEDSLTISQYSFIADFVGIYTITFTDQCGATASTTLRTEICETLVPTIFTPNGDGKNDRFEIRGIQGYRGSRVQIFDRWGKLVLDDEDYKNDWDGGGLPDGTFYYIFTRADGKVNAAGYVQKVGTK